MAHRVVILDAVREQQLRSFAASLPPRSDAAFRRLAAELGQHLICLVQHIALLVDCHVIRVLVTVSVQSDLMVFVSNCCTILWECLERVSGDEPCGFDVVLVEQLEQSLHTDGASEYSCRDSQTRQMTRWEEELPLLMSLVESSPPYEPSHPATASMSTPVVYRQRRPIEAFTCQQHTIADQNSLLAHLCCVFTRYSRFSKGGGTVD